jgi:hypothetical protein
MAARPSVYPFYMYKQKIFLLKIAASAVFLGRGWQYLLWDAPYRSFFWDESIMGPVASWLGYDWSAYLNEVATDSHIGNLVIASGCIFLCCALAVWILPRWKKIFSPLIILGVLQMLFLTFLYWKEHFFIIAQLIEYSLQWSTPLFLLYWIKKRNTPSKMFFWLKVAIALTFVGHGLYALGLFFPVPANFTVMTVKILGVNQDQAFQFLFWAGVLDMVVGLGIFLPFKWARWVLLYAVLWGLATTAARIWAHFYLENLEFVFWRWVPEALFRVPHFLMPYFLWRACTRMHPPSLRFGGQAGYPG